MEANRLPNRVAPNILYKTDVLESIQTIKELVGFEGVKLMAKIIPICLIILQDYLGLKIKNFADVCIGDNSRWYGDLALYFAECATDFTMSYGDIDEDFYDALGDA